MNWVGGRTGELSTRPSEPRPDMHSYFEEKLLLLMLDLLFHLLIEMLDFFIISSNFPAEVAEGESDEVYTQFPLSHSVSPGARTPGPRQEPGVVGGW